MFSSPSLKMQDIQAAHAFIQAHSFGALVSPSLNATHLPLLSEITPANTLLLRGHINKGDKHWRELDASQALIIFTGPHAYVSPTWYAKGPGVPTWNYAVLYCYGRIRLCDGVGTKQIIDDTIAFYEPSLGDQEPQQTNIPSPTQAYIDKLLQAIIGFTFELERFEGIEKLGQQRSSADQQGVFSALCSSNGFAERSLADYMHSRGLGIGLPLGEISK